MDCLTRSRPILLALALALVVAPLQGAPGARRRTVESQERTSSGAPPKGAGPASPRQTAEHGKSGTGLARTIVLDLSKNETYLPIAAPATGKETLIEDVVAKDLPAPYKLKPKHGVVRLGHPVDIVLDDPAGVRIRLALVKRSAGLTLRVSPQIRFGGGPVVEFTHDRIRRTIRSRERQIRATCRRMAAAVKQRQHTEAWLATPGNKPLNLVKQARMNLKILRHNILAAQRALPAARRQCATLYQVAKLAETIDGTAELQFVVRYDQKRAKGGVAKSKKQ